MMSVEEREEMTIKGGISVTCEFCSREYLFDPDAIARKIAETSNSLKQ